MISDLPTEDKYRLKAGKTTLVLLPVLSLRRGSDWLPSFETVSLLQLISTCLHPGKRELAARRSEAETAGKLRGWGIMEGHVDPPISGSEEGEHNAGAAFGAAEGAALPLCSSELSVHPEPLQWLRSRASAPTELLSHVSQEAQKASSGTTVE